MSERVHTVESDIARAPLQLLARDFREDIRGKVSNLLLQAAESAVTQVGRAHNISPITFKIRGNRLDSGNALARHEHKLQIKDTGKLNQTGKPQIDSPVLDFRDVALRHTGLRTERALREALALPRSL